MKLITCLWVFVFLLPGFSGFSQSNCSIQRYNTLIGEADTLVAQRAYSQAIRKYASAKACQPQKAAEVDRRIEKVFEKVNQERIKADSLSKKIGEEQKTTKAALKKAERLTKFFKFGQEQAAWAYDIESGYFSVIDQNGNMLSRYIYQSPGKFSNGIAVARANNQYVILRKDGKEISGRADFMAEAQGGYYLCYDKGQNTLLLNRMNGDTVAERLEATNSKGLVAFERKGKAGLMNGAGEVVLEAEYTYEYGDIGRFSEGRAMVRKGNQWGVIDTSGKLIVDPKYDRIRSFSEGRAVVLKGNQWGVIDTSGNIIVGTKYDEIGDFSEGRAVVRQGDQWGMIDMSGNIIVDPKYDHIGIFSEGRVVVRQGDQRGVIDMSGNIIVDTKYNYIGIFSEGHAVVRQGNQWGMIDMSGNVIVDIKYDDIGIFSEGRAVVRKGDQLGVIDMSGNVIVDPKYDEIGYFSEGRAMVRKGDQLGVIDRFGNKILNDRIRESNYDRIIELTHGLRKINIGGMYYSAYENDFSGGKWGLIDSAENKILEIEYDEIHDFIEGYALIKKNDKYGLIDTTGRKIFQPIYDNILPLSKSRAFVYLNNKWLLVDTSGSENISLIYSFMSDFINGRAIVNIGGDRNIYGDAVGGKSGLIDTSGLEVLKLADGDIKNLSTGKAWLVTKNELALIDMNGNFILHEPIYFDFEEHISHGFVKINLGGGYGGEAGYLSGGKWGLINSRGSKILGVEYDYIKDFSEGRAWVNKDGYLTDMDQFSYGKWGLIDTLGNLIINPTFDNIKNFSEGRAAVQLDGKWGLIGISGDTVLPPIYAAINSFKDGRAGFNSGGEHWGWFNPISIWNTDEVTGGKWGFLDIKGQIVIDSTYDMVNNFSNDRAWVNKGCTTDENGGCTGGKWGLIDPFGKLIVEYKYDNIRDFSEGRAWVNEGCTTIEHSSYLGCKWGLIDALGNIIIEPQYDGTKAFSEGLAWVNIYDKWGLIDSSGRLIVPHIYGDVRDFSKGRAWVKLNGKWGIIDISGREILAPIYDEIGDYRNDKDFINGMASLRIGNKYGLASLEGEVLPCEYSAIYPSGYQEYMLEQNGGFGFYAPRKGVLLPCNFEKIGYLGEENGWIRVQQNGKWGWVDKKGNMMIPCRYDIVAPFVNGRAKVIQEPYPEPFYINTKGEFLLESIAEER